MGGKGRKGRKGGKGRRGGIGRIGSVIVLFGVLASAQPNPNAPANFVSVSAPIVALTHARVIDGTGGAPREDQTIVIRDGSIAEVGDASRVAAPAGATVVDLTGKSVIPGLVMVHEHLYYPTGPGVYGQLGASFARLYLAGGVTTMRTGGIRTASWTSR
jgi:enamidase